MVRLPSYDPLNCIFIQKRKITFEESCQESTNTSDDSYRVRSATTLHQLHNFYNRAVVLQYSFIHLCCTFSTQRSRRTHFYLFVRQRTIISTIQGSSWKSNGSHPLRICASNPSWPQNWNALDWYFTNSNFTSLRMTLLLNPQDQKLNIWRIFTIYMWYSYQLPHKNGMFTKIFKKSLLFQINEASKVKWMNLNLAVQNRYVDH